jgi:hypothetical protein
MHAMTEPIDPNELRMWAINLARARFTWLPERERSDILGRVIAEMVSRADQAEGRAQSAVMALPAEVIPLASRRRATMGDVLRNVTGRGPDGAA